MANILVIHGPSLNLLGSREPLHYGELTLAALNEQLFELAKSCKSNLQCVQSNKEHALIDAIHDAKKAGVDFIIINPAAFTHTSIALRDALLAVQLPFVEVHLSNIYARESFRHNSYLSDIATGTICGLGPYGYHAALTYVLQSLSSH